MKFCEVIKNRLTIGGAGYLMRYSSPLEMEIAF